MLLRSIAKQIILTYINHSRPIIPDEIHLIFERGLGGEIIQSFPSMLRAKEGYVWHHLITSLV